MKKTLFLIGSAAFSLTTVANAGPIADFFGLASTSEIKKLEQELVILNTEKQGLEKEIGKLEKHLGTQTKSLNQKIAKQGDDLQVVINNQQNLLKTIDEANKLINSITQTSSVAMEKIDRLEALQSKLQEELSKSAVTSKSLDYDLIGAIAALIVALSSFVLLRKRITENSLSISQLQEKSVEISSEILERLNSEIDQLEKIATVISTSIQQDSSRESGLSHELIKTLADRITFMEMTLAKMDKTVRGYKQLSKSIVQMKDNLQANGYELVEMLGHRYHEGMKVVANFVEDEDLPAGDQIITAIIKPQINYKGVMIQAAQITVSQNV